VSPAAGATPAGTLAVRVADLQVRSRGTVTVTGTAPLKGEMTLFCRPVVAAPARVRRDGTVLADAWLPDLVRLGGLEEHLGDGVIEAIAGEALRRGRLRPRERRRLMSYPLVIRLVIAMTLLPGASYAEAMRVLAGLLADIPFTPGWHVPTGKTVTGWRLLVPAEVMEEIFRHAAGPLTGDDEPSAVMLAGMPVGAADGMLVSVAEPGEPGVLRRDRDRGRDLPVRAAADRRADRPRGPRDPRRRHGKGIRRGADPAEAAGGAAAGRVCRPHHLLRPELPRL
jgi:hypothetical protein